MILLSLILLLLSLQLWLLLRGQMLIMDELNKIKNDLDDPCWLNRWALVYEGLVEIYDISRKVN